MRAYVKTEIHYVNSSCETVDLSINITEHACYITITYTILLNLYTMWLRPRCDRIPQCINETDWRLGKCGKEAYIRNHQILPVELHHSSARDNSWKLHI